MLIEKQTSKRIKRLKTDNGMEYCSEEFEKFCRDEGIMKHKTAAETPKQNGFAERFNRTILERTRCMLISAGLPKTFWAEIVSTEIFLINRCPSTALDFKTPKEVWSGHPPDYSRLRVFGCTAYAHVRQGKLEPRALKCIFLGYSEGVKAYRLWCVEPGMRKCIVSRDVVFNEGEMGNLVIKDRVSSSLRNKGSLVNSKMQLEVGPKELVQHNAEGVERQTDWSEQEAKMSSDQTDLSSYNLTRDRERRVVKAPSRYGYADFMAFAFAVAE